MTRHEFLTVVHEAYQPCSYLEVGIHTGLSLSLSRTRTIAIDPAFKITSEIHCDVQLVKGTSDDFFARDDAVAHFPDGRIDLAFVDGRHLFEFALRDFMNVERHADWTSVIVVDDVLPRSAAEASRKRNTRSWTGDVFKLTEVLRRYRPELLVVELDTEPTGVLLVLGADPQNGTLGARYEEIVTEYVYPDPQRVPAAVLRRETAIDPSSIVKSALWTELRNAREGGLGRQAGWEGVRRSVETAARPAERGERMPPPGAARAASPASRTSAAAPTRTRRKARKRATARPPTLRGRALAAVRRRLRPLRGHLGRLGRRR